MDLTRREFLAATGAGVGAAAVRLRSARAFEDPTLRRTIEAALDTAKKRGASYADVRVVRLRHERITAREDHLTEAAQTESYGLGVRALKGGAWGFAATAMVIEEEARRVAELAVSIAATHAKLRREPVTLAPAPAVRDVWQTPLSKNPFKIALAEKVDLLLHVNAEALKVPGAKYVRSWSHAIGEWKIFASTDGSWIEQSITRLGPGYEVTAVDAKSGEFEKREHDLPPMQAGWEHVTGSSFATDARRVAEEAVEKLRAPSVEPGRRDLILAPNNLWLTIHESVGHPTELDRALGYEANFAGTSFATIDKLHKYIYASKIVTLYADKTTPGGLATCAYDDDGVATQRWDLVDAGRFVGYQTTREQAAWIGEKASRGCSYGEGFAAFPFQRMPNVSLAPGRKDLDANDLIAATQDGIYIVGRGSWSIDQQRYNFQFSGQMFYEVKRGKIRRALRDVAYQSSSPEFWRSCDLIGGPKSFELHGSLYDGKGEPPQSNPVSHGCPPARFKKVNILNISRRKRPA